MASDKRMILITGANNGIGYDSSYALAAASSNNHIIMSARTPSKGEKAVKDMQARDIQGTVSFLHLDVTDDKLIAAAAKKIEDDFGHIDVLVNNAGIALLGELNREQFARTFDTNVFGAYLLTEALAPLLQKSKDPRIINVSSGLGSIACRMDPKDAYYGLPADTYRMSKAALNMATACMAAKYKEVKVWSYCPGYVITDLTGAEQREMRKNTGAESSETSAAGLKEIIEGQRDGETDKFVQRYGKQYPW